MNRKVKGTWIATVVILASTSASLAQPSDPLRDDVDTNGLVVEATVGWDSTLDSEHPVPISMLLSNFAEESVEGKILLSDPANGAELEIGEIFLGPNGNRRFSSVLELLGWSECFVSLRNDAGILFRRELILNTGKVFEDRLNYILVVGENGRNLKSSKTNSVGQQASGSDVADAGGRPMRSLSVRSWEIPEHFGVLTLVQAVLFPDDFKAELLNRKQWTALAHWMCQGGIVFCPREASEIQERLRTFSPLKPSGPADEELSAEFQIQPVGLGQLRTFSRPVFSSDSTSLRDAIEETVKLTPKNQLYRTANAIRIYRRKAGRADRNMAVIAIFFVAYTVLSGGVVLFLLRWTRKQIFRYTISVVVGASCLAAVLGGALGQSLGDLRWASVTVPTKDGLIQVANVEVHSAGARNQKVTVVGPQVDMQLTERGQHYHRWSHWQQRWSYPAYTWLANQAKGDARYQTKMSISPWGQRSLQAVAFKSGVPVDSSKVGIRAMLDLAKAPPRELDLTNPARRSAIQREMVKPLARFSLQIDNELPFAIEDCILVVGVSFQSAGVPAVVAQHQGWNRDPPRWAVKGEMIDMYATVRLSSLAAGESRQFEGELEFERQDWIGTWGWNPGDVPTPKLSRLGTGAAWFMGRLDGSPAIQVDAEQTDFTEQDQCHFLLQELDLRNVTGLDELVNSSTPEVPEDPVD